MRENDISFLFWRDKFISLQKIWRTFFYLFYLCWRFSLRFDDVYIYPFFLARNIHTEKTKKKLQ